MESIDRGLLAHAQTDVHAAVVGNARHVYAPVNPEFGIFLSVADRGIRPFAQFGHAERRQQRGVKAFRSFEVAHRNRDVIDHAGNVITPARSISPV